jgi:hypothetical protein
LTDFAAGSWNWVTSSVSTGSIYASWLKRISGQEKTFGLQNVCHSTDRPREGGGTTILVRRGINHYGVTVPGLTPVGGRCHTYYVG